MLLRGEGTALRFERKIRNLAAAPAGDHQRVLVLRGEIAVGVVRLQHGDRAAHLVVHSGQDVGPVGRLALQPAARPTEVRTLGHMQQPTGSVQRRQALVIVVVGEQVPVLVEAEPARIPQPAREAPQVGPVGADAEHGPHAVVGHRSPVGVADANGLLKVALSLRDRERARRNGVLG